jgi:hypothetical protein
LNRRNGVVVAQPLAVPSKEIRNPASDVLSARSAVLQKLGDAVTTTIVLIPES